MISVSCNCATLVLLGCLHYFWPFSLSRVRHIDVDTDAVGHVQVVEQMTRESQHMDVDKVLGFLMDAKLADSRPLINVCDRFDRVTELTTFLYKNNLRTYIEGYVQKVNPSKTPQVVGGLLDSQADEKFMSDLIMSVRTILNAFRHVLGSILENVSKVKPTWFMHCTCMRRMHV
jgi:hypothetical protein